MSWFYRIIGRFPTLVIARRNISRARVRSALAALSILIGVVAIGATGAGGAAFKQSQLDRIQEQGATNVFVAPGTDRETDSFDRTEINAIAETVGPAGVVATKSRSMEYVVRSGERESISATYIEDPQALYDIAAGEVPVNWRQSAVVSNEFASAHGIRPGDRITLVRTDGTVPDQADADVSYRVVAVLAPTAAFGVDEVFLPIEAGETTRYEQVRITTRSVDRAAVVADRLRDRFNDRKDRLLVFEFTSLVRLFRSVVDGINAFLAGIAAISLLVAGVSIANTMLMAVIERREEIGVLRAVGYSKAAIVRILLVEAFLLGLLGVLAGTVVAAGIAMIANSIFLGDPLAFSQTAILYLLGGATFGIVTSLLAGVYPAWRAASDNPADALRY